MSVQESGPSTGGRSWWTRGRIALVAVGGVVATTIGVVSIAVPLIVASGARQSAPDTVVAEAAGAGMPEEEETLIPAVSDGLMAAAGDVSSDSVLVRSDWWAVPVDAPWDELFASPACVIGGAGEWISAHGTPIMPYEISTMLTNVATTGSEAVVSDIRAEGELTVPDAETVVVGVMGCSGGADEGVYAHMTLGVDPVAVWHECYDPSKGWTCAGAAEELPTPGDPVRFAIQPGEATNLHLSWEQTLDFVGRFVATVTVDGESSTIDLSPGSEDLVVPWVTYPERRLYISYEASEHWCESTPGARMTACTAEQWRQIVAGG